MTQRSSLQALAIAALGLAGPWGCSAKCDVAHLETAWRGLQTPPPLDQTLQIVGQACPAMPEALLSASSSAQVETLAPVLSCAGPDAPMETQGPASSPVVRGDLWDECKADETFLGSKRQFMWASGRPEMALALHRFLLGNGVDTELTAELSQSVLASPMVPIDDGFQPLRLASTAQPTQAAAPMPLVAGASERAAAADTDTVSAVAAALQSSGALALVGLSAPGDAFVERTFVRDETAAFVQRDSLSLWLDEGKGLSLFDGKTQVSPSTECPGYSLCWPEDFGAATEALVSSAEINPTPTALRVGLLEGDLPLAALEAMLEHLPMPAGGQVALATPPTPPPADPALTATARWLAGLSDDSDTLPASLRESRQWTTHKNWLDKRFESYDKRHLSKIRAWVPDHLTDDEPYPLFYPFSGPDIFNAVTFFPGRPTYVMGGLEAIGGIPLAPKSVDSDVVGGLEALRQGLHNYLAQNYFITWQMLGTRDFDHYTKLGAHNYNGTAAIMMVFLARTGHEILTVRKVTLTEQGELVDAADLKGRPHALAITFRGTSTAVPNPNPEQSLVFFSGDLSDRSLSKLRGFVPMVESLGKVTTFLKAASYLMFNPNFDDMRSVILARSETVVTEASGVPFHFFERDTETWKLDLYGQYREPIGDFRGRCQPNLHRALEASDLAPLPFRYGYHPRNHHMIVAHRKTSLTKPAMDGTTARGTKVFLAPTAGGCPTTGEPTIRSN